MSSIFVGNLEGRSQQDSPYFSPLQHVIDRILRIENSSTPKSRPTSKRALQVGMSMPYTHRNWLLLRSSYRRVQ